MINQIKNDSGFTLIELVIVIVILGLISTYAIPRAFEMVDSARLSSTRDEMMKIKIAIIGDASSVSGGVATYRGYMGDVGSIPGTIQDLITKPAGVSAWDRTANNGLGAGWNGPYTEAEEYEDAWGNAYVLNPDSTIVSWGPNGADDSGSGDDIVLNY